MRASFDKFYIYFSLFCFIVDFLCSVLLQMNWLHIQLLMVIDSNARLSQDTALRVSSAMSMRPVRKPVLHKPRQPLNLQHLEESTSPDMCTQLKNNSRLRKSKIISINSHVSHRSVIGFAFIPQFLIVFLGRDEMFLHRICCIGKCHEVVNWPTNGQTVIVMLPLEKKHHAG